MTKYKWMVEELNGRINPDGLTIPLMGIELEDFHLSSKIDEQNQPNFLAMSPLKYLIGLSNPIKKDIKQYKGEIIPLPAVSLESL